MTRPLHFHRYQLQPKSGAPAREGALVRVETDFGPGYGDLHPWPELGDRPLVDQMSALGRNLPTALGARTLSFARADAIARSRSESLFNGLAAPSSHALFLSPDQMTAAAIEAFWEEGFRVFKTKCGAADLDIVQRAGEALPEGAKLRLDFNHRLNASDVDGVLARLRLLVDKIDFAEDFWPREMAPRPTSFPIAIDRDGESRLEAGEGADVIVFKPAVQDGERLARAGRDVKRWVVTSYLDHPLGQASAAWEAAKLFKRWPDRASVAGLLSHRVYETTAFSERLTAFGPSFVAPSGAGFGFGDLLGALTWERA